MPEKVTKTERNADAIDAADPFTDGDVTGVLDEMWDDLTS